jgi:hypothetical protein
VPETLHYESPARPTRSPAVRIFVLVGLLLFGFQLWLLSDFWLYRPMWRVAIYVAALTVCFLRPVQRSLERLTRFLEPTSARRTVGIVFAIVLASTAVLYATALSSDRQFTPIFHDEFAYLLQARMFASGHLWMPPHPLGDFFETFYVIVDRVYAPQYFPGAALMLVPGALLGLPEWVMPLVIAGLTCGGMFLLMRELFGGGVGLASIVLLIGVLGFRVVSITAIAQTPAMLLFAVGMYALLRWDRSHSLRWMVAAGVAIGWLLVTRPLEGVIVGSLGAAFVALKLWDSPAIEWRRVIVSGLLPVLPFVMLQFALNRGITGHWLQTPFGYYAERDMPGTALGFHGYDASKRPVSKLPQKQDFFDIQVTKAVREHTLAAAFLDWPRKRFFNSTTEIFPDMLLVIVVPASLLALRDPRRWLVLLVMPLWWVAYTLHVFSFAHYYVFYSASMFVLIFAGFDGVASCLGPHGRRTARAAQIVMPIVISVMAMPQFKKDVRDQWFANPVELALEREIARLPTGERAIVLVRYDASAIPEQEVVYNVDTAWPDDARVIRAHDLGPERDVELYRYYAGRQPERSVYRFDRKDLSFVRLGTVKELDAAATRPTIGENDAPTERSTTLSTQP